MMDAVRQLGAELHRMYESGGASGERVTMIHLFGIRYAEELGRVSIPDVVAASGISKSYATEVSKGMKLARHVTVSESK